MDPRMNPSELLVYRDEFKTAIPHAIPDFRSLGQIDLVTIPPPLKFLNPGDSVGMLALWSTRAYESDLAIVVETGLKFMSRTD